MALYYILTFAGWGAIITAFLLMFRWHKKDTMKKIEEKDRQIKAIEKKMSLLIEHERKKG